MPPVALLYGIEKADIIRCPLFLCCGLGEFHVNVEAFLKNVFP